MLNSNPMDKSSPQPLLITQTPQNPASHLVHVYNAIKESNHTLLQIPIAIYLPTPIKTPSSLRALLRTASLQWPAHHHRSFVHICPSSNQTHIIPLDLFDSNAAPTLPDSITHVNLQISPSHIHERLNPLSRRNPTQPLDFSNPLTIPPPILEKIAYDTLLITALNALLLHKPLFFFAPKEWHRPREWPLCCRPPLKSSQGSQRHYNPTTLISEFLVPHYHLQKIQNQKNQQSRTRQVSTAQ